ncbi:hypothetical protein [Flavobacterium sp. UGB4466]|uniref:hypothetical protein n=1 Tax=Flavobacterium sp. UGB4466 TaxID=2730889 RepID=UPI00192A8806|nr:hypothetical protein [Flavobacterium sp. UGB4466]
MASSLQVTVQNAVQASSDLTAIFGICLGSGVTPTAANWQDCLQLVYTDYQQQYSTPTIQNFTAGIYTAWAVGQPTTATAPNRLSAALLVNGLRSVQNGSSPAFAAADIVSVISTFYAIINIIIDTAGILAKYNNNSASSIFLGAWDNTFIAMNDNDPNSQGEGTAELQTNGLSASQTIEWKATNKTGTAVIDLTGFVAGSTQLYTLVYLPVSINDTQYYTQVLPNPVLNSDSYYFQFTIDSGTTTYYWDPFLK